MKSGLLVSQFSTEAGLASAAIRYLSCGDVSHVDLIVPRAVSIAHGYAPVGVFMLLGARFNGGVRLRPSNYANFTRTARLGCVVPDIDAAYDFAFAQIGKPYNCGAILDFFLHKFGRANVFNPDQKTWFCDELNYEIYKAGGVQLLDEVNPLNLSPQCELLSPYWKTQQAV